MSIEISPAEAWKILDAVLAYKKDYELSTQVKKTLTNIEKKMKKIVHSE
jgi:exonuclease VII small subunit